MLLLLRRNILEQLHAFNVLLHNVEVTRIIVGLEVTHNIRMIQRGQNSHLSDKKLDKIVRFCGLCPALLCLLTSLRAI